jgi:predicted dehydrogenase
MLHFAIVGCGKMCGWHAYELSRIPEAKVVALVDPIAERCAEVRAKYHFDAADFRDIETLFGDSRIKLDAVNLVTPHTLHHRQAKMALERGLHVLTEKPMVTNSKDAYDLWRTVKASGKKLGITYQAPYTDEYAYLADLRDSGKWGKVQLVNGWVSQDWMRKTHNTWRQDPALSGGGQMFDTGAHLLNAVMWLMNEPIVQAACFCDRLSTPVDINGVAIAKFQSGVMANFCIGGNCPPFKAELVIQTDAMLILTDQFGKKVEILGPDGSRIHPQARIPPPHHPPHHTPASPHRNFVNAILGREALRVPVRYGVLLNALMDSFYESADNGRMVRVEPVPMEI